MRILISGAGIAGPALAYWLRHYGNDVTVIEKAPAPRAGGQAIDIRGTAREVVERMGILPEIRAAHTGVRGMAYVDGSGRRAVEVPADLLGESGGMIADIEILRTDLVRILHRATADVPYVYGDHITALTETAHGVEVQFRNSAARTFDLVVGADGVHSAVRRLAFGPESEFVTDSGYCYAIFGAELDLELDDWELMYSAPGRRMAMLYPIGRHTARCMFFFTPPPSTGDNRQLVADIFADAGWQVPKLLDAMWTADDFYLDRPGRVQVDKWWRGRTVLLGDSVSGGSVGMGTSMSLVGAYVLAGELAAAGGDHEKAFAAYQREMADFVTECLKPMPGGVNGMLPKSRTAIRMRNAVMKLMLATPLRGKLTGGLEETANAIALKDYAALTCA